jgi:hypothetical protein
MGLYRWAAWANPTDMAIANSATAKVFNMISSSLKTAKHAKGFDGPISSASPQHRVFDLNHVYCDGAQRIAANIANLPELLKSQPYWR